MCRIAGLADFKNSISHTQHQVEQMCNLLIHGGPDDGGIFIAESCHLVLGNRRLSLLDLSSEGHMPMTYLNQYHITYNGEIYNYQQLKNELIALGHQFSNKTDTEVILAAYAQWGVLAFSKLEGMFAFALFDAQSQELFLARDAAGIKPLYYNINENGLGFASEVRALASVSILNSQNNNWPIYMMAYGHLPEPITTSNDIKPLPKGFFLKYSFQNRQYHYQSFSHFSYSSAINDEETAKRNTKTVLSDAIERQLLADAPIGVFLSGGLDSSIIASLASSFQKDKLNTLSIYFDEEAYSEKKYQDVLIQQLQCNHHQLLLKQVAFEEALPQILSAMDLPSCDGINTWFISKYAAENGLKAVLSGLGGDELYGGYPSFSRFNKAKWLQQLPDFIKTVGKNSSSKRLSRMSYLKLNGIKGIYLFLRGHFTPVDIARYLECDESEVWATLEAMPAIIDTEGIDDKNMASWMEFNLYMQNQLLRDSDVMSMNHGVEIRVPFLDDKNIRMANKISSEIKFSGKLPKQFLIDTFIDDIPQEIWNRPKMGFSFPFSQWLSESHYVEEVMLNGNQQSKNNYKKFMSGKLHWSQLMLLLLLNHRNIR